MNLTQEDLNMVKKKEILTKKNGISHKKSSTWLRKGNFKREKRNLTQK